MSRVTHVIEAEVNMYLDFCEVLRGLKLIITVIVCTRSHRPLTFLISLVIKA